MLLALQLAVSQSVDSCNFVLEGTILDIDSKEPIPFATVTILAYQKGTVTNENGEFQIQELCQDEYEFSVSHIGYKTKVHHHDSYHDNPTILLARDDQMLESIVVEGAYNPSYLNTITIERLDWEAFENSKNGSFAELAGQISGISLLSTGQNVSKPIVHGLHSNRVLIINNGVRHEYQGWGGGHAPEIDPTLASSIQVLKGAGTVRYGPEALGGVVLIDTELPDLSSGFGLEVAMVGATNGKSGSSNLTMQQGWEHLVLDFRGSLLNQGDLSTPDYILSNTGKKENSYSGAIKFHKNQFDLIGSFSSVSQELGILRGSVNGSLEDLNQAILAEVPNNTQGFSYEINNPRQVTNHQILKVRGIYLLDNQDVSMQYSLQTNTRQEYDVRRGTNNQRPSIDLELVSHNLDFDWNHNAFRGFDGVVGLQYAYQNNDNQPGTNTAPFLPNFNLNRLGLFWIEHWKRDQLTVEWGVRYDYQHINVRGRSQTNDLFNDELEYSQLTGSLGLMIDSESKPTFSSNIGLGWRPPSVSELYSFGTHDASVSYGLWRYSYDVDGQIDVNQILTNGDRPAKSEVGLKWVNNLSKSNQSYHWDVTGYVNWIQNFIYSRPSGITNSIRGAFPFFTYEQTNAIFTGVDAVLRLNHSPNIRSNYELSYVMANDTEYNDFFVEIPPLLLKVGLVYSDRQSVFNQSRFGVDFSYSFRQFRSPRVISIEEILDAQVADVNLFADDPSNFDFIQAPPGYLIGDVFWRASKDSFSWSIQVKNLLNARYRMNTDRFRYYSDNLGRNLILTLSYRI